MDVADRFLKALDVESSDQRGDPDLLAVRLARATAAALPVDGAGLSVHGESGLRTPLAASDEAASLAERLQFTVGRGPCLLAARLALPVRANEAHLAEEWPIFHDLLVSSTSFRSMLALPLPGQLRGLGTLSLYRDEPTGVATVRLTEAGRVARLIAEHLGPAADWSAWTPHECRGVANTPDARRRSRVWMAVGSLMLALQLRTDDALGLLRGYAYASGRTLDDVADDLVQRRIHPDRLLGDGPLDR
jgi:ANTAR domain